MVYQYSAKVSQSQPLYQFTHLCTVQVHRKEREEQVVRFGRLVVHQRGVNLALNQ